MERVFIYEMLGKRQFEQENAFKSKSPTFHHCRGQ